MGSPATTLPTLLGAALLAPLVSFTIIVLVGRRLGPHGKWAGYLAVGAIVTSFCLSAAGMAVWLKNNPLVAAHHGEGDGEHTGHNPDETPGVEHQPSDDIAEPDHGAQSAPVGTAARRQFTLTAYQPEAASAADDHGESADAHADAEGHHVSPKPNEPPKYYYGDWYALGVFGKLKLTIGYYIDALTVTMFCMVSFIASCVHIYALGYMHDELHDPYVDHEVTLSTGKHLHRRGRFHRFFQYLSLFSFSMLGVVIAGNMAMVFVFWELVGITSYFLIGFYIERHSASTAANKAFIVNRVGDFGMLIGMMALWASLGTFAFGDMQDAKGQALTTESGAIAEPGVFTLLRSQAHGYRLEPTDEMVTQGRRMTSAESQSNAGQWLLFVAGVGIFCGCVGKSAQFPLHVWLPDAMEGPTPVSALVHSATMVAAGVYLVGRFYPAFSPEVLLVIAIIGCITLSVAATIAITAVDIKRVLAYSTVSQLGYMMLALGLGAWTAGLFHLVTHAFFKSLLFLCSGSVIHAVHTNDMRQMGGLRHKMPITAYTMLVGCLAIIGAGIPLTAIGLSGYYSKDAIIEQAWSFAGTNQGGYWLLLIMPAVGAALTAFYMFRLWYMTFAGAPRDHHRYEHAHESPAVMTYPLIVLAAFAIFAGWEVPFTNFSVTNLLAQAQPVGTAATAQGTLLPSLTMPAEVLSHAPEIRRQAGLAAFAAAMSGLLLATVIYLWRMIDAGEIRHTFRPVYQLFWNKWWFDELYGAIFIAPTKFLARRIARFDRLVIDGILHASAAISRGFSKVVGAVFDGVVVDGTVNAFANWTWDFGLLLRRLQTGNLRQYVLFILFGTWLTWGAWYVYILMS